MKKPNLIKGEYSIVFGTIDLKLHMIFSRVIVLSYTCTTVLKYNKCFMGFYCRYIEFIFANVEQATEQAELLSELREDINVKHMTLKDKRG